MLKTYALFFALCICYLHMLCAWGGWGVYMQIAYAKRTFGVEFFPQSQKP